MAHTAYNKGKGIADILVEQERYKMKYSFEDAVGMFSRFFAHPSQVNEVECLFNIDLKSPWMMGDYLRATYLLSKEFGINDIQNIIQFLTLAAYDMAKYGNASSYQYALSYATRPFFSWCNYGHYEKQKVIELNKRLLEGQVKDMEVVAFFANLELLSDTACSKPFIVHQNLLSEEDFKRMGGQENNAGTPGISQVQSSHQEQEAPVLDEVRKITGNMTPSSYYHALDKQSLSAHDRAVKKVEVFCLVAQYWCGHEQQAQEAEATFSDLLHYCFGANSSAPDIQTQHETQELLNNYLPTALKFMEQLKSHNPQATAQQVQLLIQHGKQINSTHMQAIEHQMKVFKKFLQNKLQDMS